MCIRDRLGPQSRSDGFKVSRKQAKKQVVESREDPANGQQNDNSLKNLLVSGRGQSIDDYLAKEEKPPVKVSRKDLMKLTDNNTTRMGSTMLQENTNSFSSLTPVIESKAGSAQGKAAQRVSLYATKEIDEEEINNKSPTGRVFFPKAKPPLGPTQSKAVELGNLASTYAKSNQMYLSEPLKMPKFTIDSSIFGSITTAKPLPSPGKGDTYFPIKQSNSKRGENVKFSNELYDHLSAQQRLSPNIPSSSKTQNTASGLKIGGQNVTAIRDENDKSLKSSINAISMPGRQLIPSSQRQSTNNGVKLGKNLIGVSTKRQSSSQPTDRGPLSGIPVDEVGYKVKGSSSNQSLSFANTISIYGARGK
eukprot:TRINITY_DN11686_c0_g1_i2.p1 TRINITY_DN11686_c0_g1~~TRINITY_DN11686_c0_g1_i2.p1  ORF type:complete len:363 (+),score=58.53 TRINITY_DN11686_c0_g1_i2:65-1153(+)